MAAYWFLDLCRLYTIETWEKVLYTALPFAAFVDTAFLFAARWKTLWARLSIRVCAVIAAAVLSGVCLWVSFLQESFIPSSALGFGYLLLLFVLSFFLAERPPKAAKRDNTEGARG